MEVLIMLHIYVCKGALAEVPPGAVALEIPERMTHRVLGEDVTIPMEDLNEEGWSSWIRKGKRIISDGSPTVDVAREKVLRLCGEGKPIGEKTTRDILAGYFASAVTKRIAKSGVKVKDIPKLGKNVEEITTSAKEYGIPDSWIKKALKHSKAQADLEQADIE